MSLALLAPAPAGATVFTDLLFENEFDPVSFNNDFDIIQASLSTTFLPPSLTELTVTRQGVLNLGIAETTDAIALDGVPLDELEFLLVLGAVDAVFTQVNLLWFDSAIATSPIAEELLFDVPRNFPVLTQRTGLDDTDVPGATHFRLQLIVFGEPNASATYDYLAAGQYVTVPEPGLLAPTLALIGGMLAARRRRP